MSRKTRILIALGALVIVLLVLGGALAWRPNDGARRDRSSP
jgi:hypothetical protein